MVRPSPPLPAFFIYISGLTIVQFVINFSATTNFHYSGMYGAVRYSSHMLMAYVCGLIFHLAMEKPTANVERIFLPNKKKH